MKLNHNSKVSKCKKFSVLFLAAAILLGCATPPLKATLNAPVTSSGFKIDYEVNVSYKAMDTAGRAAFTFIRTESTYRAQFISRASITKFIAQSEGEVRRTGLATTRFEDAFSISLSDINKERYGNHFLVDYPTQQISFGNSIQPLPYDVVYDYISAILQIQNILQSSQSNIKSLKLPIIKRNGVQMTRVVFEEPEQLSTYEGVFTATPVTIVIPSGKIQRIKVWFVAEKQYLPLQIVMSFNSGDVIFNSRESFSIIDKQ